MPLRCVACGKIIESGATIIGGNVYCQDCARLLDDLIDEYESLYLESKIFGKTLPDINEYIEKNMKTIERLKLSPIKVKKLILSRLARLMTSELRR